MNITDDRIKVAEAMGWKPALGGDAKVIAGSPTDFWDVWRDPTGVYFTEELPDPFTDANDDYAVLEWARKRMDFTFTRKFYESCANITRVSDYQIGDYAKAALEVIE